MLDYYKGTIAKLETENIDEIVHNIANELEDQQQQQHQDLKREERVAQDDLVQQGRRVPNNENVQREQAARQSETENIN